MKDKLDFLSKRKPFHTNKVLCKCLKSKQEKRIILSGLSRVDKELEIDRFLKTQVKLRIAFKALFSKIELFLIQNNKRFVINAK